MTAVKKAINQGERVYVCYDRNKTYHSGLIQHDGFNRYSRFFLGLKMDFNFTEGKNNDPLNYFVL